VPKQKPRQGAGLSWSRLSDEGCRRAAKSSAASPPPQRPAAPLVAHSAGEDARTKKPRRKSGASCLWGLPRGWQTHRHHTTAGCTVRLVGGDEQCLAHRNKSCIAIEPTIGGNLANPGDVATKMPRSGYQ